MIFKYLSTDPFGQKSWEYYDGVEFVKTYNDDAIGRPVVSLFFDCDVPGIGMEFPVNEEAYLMNDNGKTIQSFHGPCQILRDTQALKDMGVEGVEEIGIKYDND